MFHRFYFTVRAKPRLGETSNFIPCTTEGTVNTSARNFFNFHFTICDTHRRFKKINEFAGCCRFGQKPPDRQCWCIAHFTFGGQASFNTTSYFRNAVFASFQDKFIFRFTQ